MSADQVDAFMNKLEHPLKQEMETVRKIILSAGPPLEEGIKWNAPNFSYRGQDRITFNLNGKGFFRLIFHCGAKAGANREEGPLIQDVWGMLDWAAPDRAVVKLKDAGDVEAKRRQLAELVRKWIEAAG